MGAAKKLELIQGSPEWLQTRYDYLTASQAPVLFDLSRFQTPLGLFEEKIMREELQSHEGKEILFERGHNAEKKAREWLKAKGFVYEPAVMVNATYPDLLASLDGISPDGKRMLECKFVGKEVLRDIRNNRIPADHLCQIQTGLLVSKCEICDYFATDPDGDSHWLEIKPDSLYQSEIALAAKTFMEGVRSGRAPEPGMRDFFVPDNDKRFSELEGLKAELDQVEAKFEALKKEIVEAYKDKRRVQSGAVQIIKSVRKGNIDYAKVPMLRGIDLEKYRKASTDVTTVRFSKGAK